MTLKSNCISLLLARHSGITTAATGPGAADHQREVHPTESEADVRVPPDQVPAPEAARRRQEVPEGVRHGAPGAVVHAVQVEEGLHQIRGGQLKLFGQTQDGTVATDSCHDSCRHCCCCCYNNC